MITVAEILIFLDDFAPKLLAEDWDNVGLLLGSRDSEATSVMTCLTLTPNVAEEAIAEGANLIVSHHPILFRAVQKLTTDNSEGVMLLNLARANVSVFSPHTRYDSARGGINQQLAELLGLTDVAVLRPSDSLEPADGTVDGAGRYGSLSEAISLSEFNDRVKQALKIDNIQYVGAVDHTIQQVAIACGAAAEFLRDAKRAGCDVLLTGEARFHACLEAEQLGMAMVLPGHYATERPAMEQLARILEQQFTELRVWASQSEYDPVQWG